MESKKGKRFMVRRGKETSEFTQAQWDGLGADKSGWVRESEKPAEVAELDNKKATFDKLAQLEVLGLPGLLTYQEAKAIPAESWNHVLDALRNVPSRLDVMVSERVRQITGTRAPSLQPSEQTPTKPEETPLIAPEAQEAAFKATSNEPPVKDLTAVTGEGLPAGPDITEGPVLTDEEVAAKAQAEAQKTGAANTEGEPAANVNKGGRPRKTTTIVDDADEAQKNHA